MARRMFRIGTWLALAAAVLTAALTVTTAVLGVLALTGPVTYPVDVRLGPLHFRDTVVVRVANVSPVCQTVDLRASDPKHQRGDGSFCYPLFQEGAGQDVREGVVHQDTDVRPTDVLLSGEVQLTTSGGWNSWVAAQVVRKVVVGTVITMWLLLMWRLLAAAAGGDAFTARSVRLLRALGWLTVAAALLAPALDHLTSIYAVQSVHFAQYGPPFLDVVGSRGYPGGINVVQVALGGVVLLVAEIFRHGAAIEDERRLTV
ncbi:DUF2975 domain-containing protein [Isoptericola sp. NPDC057191]|uniref:DUF2975 domain-containing protein n=1 Tax=Isoptericola sp. NPDC057191 TaxID=3346041 RepID=UPI00363EC43A